MKVLGSLLMSALATAVAGCATAKVATERQIGAPTAPPAIVYVADFELDAANVRTERGLLPSLPPPPPGLPKLPGSSREPTVRAREVVDLMSKSLMKELEAKGLTVRRLRSGEQPPASGWLVRGVFTNAQQGNQVQRAVIGFGVGATELQALVTIDDLSRGAPKPMYEVQTSAESGKLPGAVILLNPYVAAARFVMSGSDLDRNVKQTAAKIAEQTLRRLQESRAAAA